MSGRIYDQYNNHIGYVEEYGSGYKTFDEYHNHTGYVESYGSGYRIFDEYHNHTGYIERYGSGYKTFDEYHNHTGYIELNGSSPKLYDSYGNNVGSTSSSSSSSYGGGYSSGSGSSSSYGGGSSGDGCLTTVFSWIIGIAFWAVVISLLLNGCENDNSRNNTYVEPEYKQESTAPQYATYERDGRVYYAEGYCGEGVKWELESNGTLWLYKENLEDPTPARIDLDDEFDAPWLPTYKYDIKQVYFQNLTGSIPPYAFSGYPNLEHIDIWGENVEDGITEISDHAFFSCDSLYSVYLYSDVQIIGDSAFFGCEKLYDFLFGDSIKEIGNMAFSCCNSLSEVWLPKTLEKIHAPYLSNVFESSMKEIYYEGSADDWEKILFIDDGDSDFLGSWAGTQLSNEIKIYYDSWQSSDQVCWD